MLTIEGTRFGDVSVPNEAIIHFPRGLIGFAAEDRFVLLERGPKSQIGYLQSVTTPKLCFPVVDGAVAGKDYPRPTAPELARDVGLSADDVASTTMGASRLALSGLSGDDTATTTSTATSSADRPTSRASSGAVGRG